MKMTTESLRTCAYVVLRSKLDTPYFEVQVVHICTYSTLLSHTKYVYYFEVRSIQLPSKYYEGCYWSSKSVRQFAPCAMEYVLEWVLVVAGPAGVALPVRERHQVGGQPLQYATNNQRQHLHAYLLQRHRYHTTPTTTTTSTSTSTVMGMMMRC
mmetsp:Transcript_10280/g.17193  ORF Transcript_10280/g.17193 Transcript_10280/m.17193 type:complete len:154 (-) Transcript_10280:867-1328(-)